MLKLASGNSFKFWHLYRSMSRAMFLWPQQDFFPWTSSKISHFSRSPISLNAEWNLKTKVFPKGGCGTTCTLCMNLENILKIEKNQTQKTTYHMIPTVWNVQKKQIHRDRKYISSCQGLKYGEDQEPWLTDLILGMMERSSNCTTWWIHQKSLNSRFKGWILCYEIISQLKQKKANRTWALGVLTGTGVIIRGSLTGHIKKHIFVYTHEMHSYVHTNVCRHTHLHIYTPTHLAI